MALSANIVCVGAWSDSSDRESIPTERTGQVNKYKYFDLITLQGIEPCDNDSCVTVTKMDDSIRVDYDLPEKFSLTLFNKGNYWYSSAEFDMHKDKYKLGKSESRPRRYDRFILNDKIFEYEQSFDGKDIFKAIYIKAPKRIIILHLGNEDFTEKDPDKILKRILNVLNYNDMHIKSKRFHETIYDVNYYPDFVEYIDIETGTKYYNNYPDLLVWGGYYGINKSNF